MKKKIFEGKCPWDRQKKMIIYINEEVWRELLKNFNLPNDLKIIAKKWQQSNVRLIYFLRRFLKIDYGLPLTLAQYDWLEHLIILYPEIIILAFDVSDEKNLKHLLVLRLAHEFGHARDGQKIKQIYVKICQIRPKEKKIKMLIRAKQIFEERAKQFVDEFSVLFIDAIEIEII